MFPTLKATWLWARNPHRKALEFPPQTAMVLFVLAWWLAWDLTDDIFRGFWLVWLGIAGGVTWWLFLKMLDRKRELDEDGLHHPWWRVPFDVVTSKRKFADIDNRWAMLCEGRLERGNPKRAPKLYRHQLTADGSVKALVSPGSIGGDLSSIVALAVETIPSVMKCHSVQVVPAGHGSAWLTFHRFDPLKRILPITQLPVGKPGYTSFGIAEDGEVAEIRRGKSILCTGATESGKGSVGWSFFFDLFRDGEPTEIIVIDPKRMEFSVLKKYVGQWIGNLYIKGYYNTAAEAEPVLAEFVKEMHVRQAAIGVDDGRKMEKATKDFPARCILVDEMSDVKSLFDTKAGGASSHFGLILSQGRATQDFIVSFAQVSKVSVLGDIRDLYPLRVALRTTTAEGTKTALGIGENEGVPCSSIPFSTPGVGYYVTDSGIKKKFRAAFASDRHIQHLLTTGTLPKGMITRDLVAEYAAGPAPGKTFSTYVCSDFARPGDLEAPPCTYVGKTTQLPRERFKQHLQKDRRYCEEHGQVENWWKRHVDPKTIIITPYPSEEAMDAAELRLIEGYQPIFNIQGNDNNPLANNVKPTGVPKPRTRPRRKAVTAPRPRAQLVAASNDHLTHIDGYGDSE